ncbi:MAG TPA: tyrosine/phenylalanine carboxypeptidase domain-containing protein [Acidimicrobiia bacterium]|nr:tyrosine/phenylalanine carboxypeptidase domain-containing protein [Acidimicrobiia bacterium]
MPVSSQDIAVDRELSEISGRLPLLRYVTPTNANEARESFLRGEADEPPFVYRPIPDLAEIGARLAEVDPDTAEDPAVRHLTISLKEELENRLDLLSARGTPRFFVAAVELFGSVEEALYDLALELLDLEPLSPPDSYLSALEVAEAARAQIARYREGYPEMNAEVRVSDTTPGVMVEHGDLYIGSDVLVGADHVTSLLAHEVDVHVLTYANGSAQPLHTLATGLAGYDQTQEALGVLAEHLAGGLRRKRLRVLAYRVVAARMLSDQASFFETQLRLVELGAGRRTAFTTTMRAYRAGGMTKDAIYLRGLVRLFQHLAAGGELAPLFIGKISLSEAPLISELREREVLIAAPLRPRFLDFPLAARRLADIRAGLTITQLGVLSS